MHQFEIHLSSVPEVEDFVSISTSRDFPITASDGHLTVNGKSFMQMFCLKLTEPLTISAECSGEQFDRFREEVIRLLAH